MIVTKKAISRRTILRGMGATVALPLLDAMIPALTAQVKTPAKPIRRLGVVYHPNGVIYDKWLPKGVGTDFELSPTLAGLQPFRDKLTVVTGLFMDLAEALGDGGGDHSRACGGYLSGVHCQEIRYRRRVRDFDGPDCGQGVRARDTALVAPAANGRQQHRRLVRRRVQLRVQQHDLVADADAAADDREQPARRLRAAVRRQRQHRPEGPRGAPAPGPQHPRCSDGSRQAAAAASSAPRTTGK